MNNFGIAESLSKLGIKKSNIGTSTGQHWLKTKAGSIESVSPVDGKVIGKIQVTDDTAFDKVVKQAHSAFLEWRMVPAPKRGEVVRQVGLALRKYKEPLGKLVSYEMGKSYQEGLGEVQEMIDICDFAVGLSRQLTWTYHALRTSLYDRMYEQYHPLGVVGVISAFNFPVAGVGLECDDCLGVW